MRSNEPVSLFETGCNRLVHAGRCAIFRTSDRFLGTVVHLAIMEMVEDGELDEAKDWSLSWNAALPTPTAEPLSAYVRRMGKWGPPEGHEWLADRIAELESANA